MNFICDSSRRRKIILWILTFLWISSCAPASTSLPTEPTPASVMPSTIPTLTPFQPQNNALANPYAELTTPQVEPTFTPYPTHYVVSDILSTPMQVDTSAGGGSDFNSLNINNPLTGQPVSDPSLLNRRPIAIKVANSPDYIRPQSGLTLADVVFEYYIEWGDTRFIAVFYGNNPPRVGPVRSGRFFDEHVARMYDAFLVFKFADPREFNYLKESTLKDFLVVPGGGTTCPPFSDGPYRRESYNNVFFDPTKWAACAARRGIDNSRQLLRGGFFSEEAPDTPLEAQRIFSYFSAYNYSYWDFDPATHKYFRYQEANDMVNKKPEAYAPLSDDLTGLPVTADNVVVILVPYTFANQFNAHDEVYNVDLIDFGNAFVFRDGKAIQAYWNRTDVNQPLLLTDLTGNPIYMRPGRTFYEVMGTTSPYQQDGKDWHFVFQTP